MTDREIVLFADADPARDLNDDLLRSRAGDTLADILSSPRYGSTHPALATSVRRRLRWAIPAVAGAAAVMAIVVAAVLPGGAQSALAATPVSLQYPAARTATRAQAQELAATAVRSAPHATAPRTYTISWKEWALSTRINGQRVTSAVVPVKASLAKHADGSVTLTRRTAAPEFPTAADHARWADRGRPAAHSVTTEAHTWGPGQYQPMFTQPLPTDPAAMRTALSVGHPIDALGDVELLVAIADAYRDGPVTPAQQAAMFAAAAASRELEPLGPTTDRAGRAGYALGITSDYSGLPTKYVAVFDPSTGRLLDYEESLTTTAGKLGVAVPATIAYKVFE